jgi:hypothetical protein
MFHSNAFVTELSRNGESLIYSSYLGGDGEMATQGDQGFGIAVDSRGNAYVTGYTDSYNFPVKNAFQEEKQGFSDAFVTKISAFHIEDVNADGRVNCSDIAIVKGLLGKKEGQPGFNSSADVNSDGVVDFRDLALIAQHLPGGTTCSIGR